MTLFLIFPFSIPLMHRSPVERSIMHQSAFHPIHHLSPGFFHFDHRFVPARSLTGGPQGALPVFSQTPLLYGPGMPFIRPFHPYLHRLSSPSVTEASRGASRAHLSDEGPKKCPVCGKSYARMSTLRLHLRTHSGEKPYQCLVCLKSFSQAANLTAHFRIHSGEKPFKCHICSRQFSQSSSVTTHLRTHNGERPYRCRICTKAFADSSTLTKHMRTHTGEKPYQCDICQQRFSQSGNLNRHKRIHCDM